MFASGMTARPGASHRYPGGSTPTATARPRAAGSCDEFRCDDSLVVAPKPSEAQDTPPPPPIAPAADMLKQAVRLPAETKGEAWVNRGSVWHMIRRLDPTFDPRDHGHANLAETVKAMDAIVEINKGETDHTLRVRRTSAWDQQLASGAVRSRVALPQSLLRTAEMPKVLFDFTDPNVASAWQAIDDRVMGGVSRSKLRSDPGGHAVFEGEVSLERNGGFASIRSSAGDRGLAGAQACLVEVRGDPKRFKLSLLTDDGFDSLSYQAGFAPSGNQWQTVSLPISAFLASFRGRKVAGARRLDPERIRQVGLMIADRQAGRFALDIRRISLA
jgi:NADH dehydrogenase [ubiquinone] 1 alpha subcomplex assembly factor 1